MTPPTSLTAPAGPVFWLTPELIESARVASRTHPRQRIMVQIQRSEAAPVQRLLNVMQPGSYVRPHQHPRPQAIELVHVIQGAAALCIFQADGTLLEKRELRSGTEAALADMEPGVYHTFYAVEPDTVVLEIKGGPYDAKQDKIWPAWAPEENTPEAVAYLERLSRG
jgi:cupin fold WbuC family metalloprotein